MSFNLVNDAWIPVRRRDGTRERIAPWRITSDYGMNPIIALDAPRPDFNGALIQFLIGLFQTVEPPKYESGWFEWYEHPPAAEVLKETFSGTYGVFDIDGDGPRFMQEPPMERGIRKKIGSLLLETPGEKTSSDNTDLFIKRDRIERMCLPCSAVALFCMQTNSPQGGAGILTGLRGGGPLTTLVAGENLWQTMWLNVLDEPDFLGNCGDPGKKRIADKFPWMGTDRPGNGAGVVTPLDVHPALVFWGMPRRIRLDFEEGREGICDICGTYSNSPVSHYDSRPRGMNFAGGWRHPLSPHYRNRDGEYLSLHAQPGGISYRHWLGLIQADRESSREPAVVVHVFQNQRQRFLPGARFRLWAFGYDMDKMKARCWYEGMMPLVHVDDSIREAFESNAASLVVAADAVGKNLKAGLKEAWFKRPTGSKGDMSFIDASFWQGTETDFYASLESIRKDLVSGQDGSAMRERWLKSLGSAGERIFDLFALGGPIGDADPKRIALARRSLRWKNNGRNLRTLLELPTV